MKDTKRLCFLAASSIASLVAFGLTDVYWTNSSSGDWNNAANWSSAAVPNSADCHVHITNETAVTISLNSADFTIGGLSFSGADHVIGGSKCLVFGATSGSDVAPEIDVADGIAASVAYVKASTDKGCGLVKTGNGALVSTSKFCDIWNRFSFFDVQCGVYSNVYATGDSFVVGGRVYVRSGAKVAFLKNNTIENSVVFDLEENAIFDNCSARDALGGVTGSGAATNLNAYTSSMWTAGPLDFAGRLYGYVVLAPAANKVVGDEGYLRVGASNTLANARIEINPDGSYTNILRFAPGVGLFSIYQLDFAQPLPVVLEDTDGEPVTLTAGFAANYKNAMFAGCGNFVKSNGNTWTITNDLYAATGMLGAKGGTIEAGTGAEGFDAALDNISRLDIGSGATFKMKNYDDTTWDVPITGAGTVSPAGPGVWTINDFSLTNGTLAVAAPATELVLAGGVATNVKYTIGPSSFKTTITGGDYSFADSKNALFDASGNRTFEQTGGSVRCCLQSSGSSCLNDIFYTISGGRLVSSASSSIGAYPQGIGMDISGDAHVELRNASSWQHRLVSSSASHTIRISDNAYLGIDDMRIIGEAGATGTAVLELNGGLVEATSFSGPVSGTISAPAKGKIILNGGVLRSLGTVDVSWGGTFDPDRLIKAYVGSAGAFVDVASGNFDRLLTIIWPVVTDVENGADGGFVKLGRGRLRLSSPYAGTGVFEAREGRFEVTSNMGATPFSTAGVRIGQGALSFDSAGTYSVAAASGASLSYTNCATLRLANGTALTIGPSGAAASGAVGRCGHGVLGIMPAAANATLGGNATLTVNGGMATDASTGILCQPVFERRYLSGANINPYRMRFLTCDGNGALVPATAVEFNPATSDSSTVAQITTAAVAVSEDTSVGALNVELSPSGVGLTIADGKTLSIGSGNAGSVAPLILNNVTSEYSANKAAGVTGGTIDFGAAEGVIVLNAHGGVWYLPTINSSLAGSGGITFAAPTLFAMDTYRGMVALTKAGTYTGGTWIENVHVAARAAGCLGTGTVHVSGGAVEGGTLEIDVEYNGSTFANAIEISGRGPVYKKQTDTQCFGALAVRKGITLSGGVKLVDDATIATSSRGGVSAAVFSAPVTGPGRLTATGPNPIRFTAANTYSGGTLITNGVVEVADGGSLGTGPVTVCPNSTLRFLNTAPLVVANKISGEGVIEMNGAAVTLQNASEFSGAIVGDGSATGDNGYVKSGDGVVAFTNSLAYTGATLVEGGTLRLGQAPFDVPPAAESIAFRLDAAAGDTITEEDGVVAEWADADGRDVTFSTSVADANGPTLTAAALGNKPVITFDGTSQRRLVAEGTLPALQTMFFVNRIATGTHPNPSGWLNMGIFGMYNYDIGLRFSARTTVRADSMFKDGVLYVDGVSNMKIETLFDTQPVPNNAFYLLEAVSAQPVQDVKFAIGDYQGTLKRSFYGDIAEVLAYKGTLTDEERVAAERYLQNKWGLKAVANDVFRNVLPVETDVTVAEGATLDLAGGFQEVASLSGAGAVTNSSTRRATLRLADGGTSVFTGSFGGDIRLEIGSGAVLDLGGGTIHVSVLKNRGQIVNGTVTADREIGGTLMIVR